MSGFPILDLVIGMIFIYFLLSIISSSIVEMILTVTKARAKILAEWLFGIFSSYMETNEGKVKLGQAIMDHCSVTGLSGKGKSPSYIDAKNFTSALLEKLTFNPEDPLSIATDFNTLISQLKNTRLLSPELQRVFIAYAYEARDTYNSASNKTATAFEMFYKKVEDWYNSSMERITGDLKRKYSRPFTLIIAIVTAGLLNADSISIAKFLYSNPDARTKIAAQAYAAADTSSAIYKSIHKQLPANDTSAAQLNAALVSELDNINTAKAALSASIPIGWNSDEFNQVKPGKLWLFALCKILGLLATVFAIMMGAPFWFDLLNKVANLRGTGNKPPDNTTASGNASAASNTTTSPTPLTITVNTNKEEEAVG